MKTSFFIISLLLCLELILSPVLPNFRLFTTPQAHSQSSCPSGMYWNNSLKRCLVNSDAAQTAGQLKECEGMTDDAGKKECYKEHAEENAGGRWVSNPLFQKGASLAGGPVNLAAAYVGVIFAAKALSKQLGTCSAVSYWALVAGSAALVSGDILWTWIHAQNLNSIQSEWQTIVKPNTGNKDDDRANSAEAQSKSFEMLAKSEESLAEMAKWKAIFFGAATVAYITAATAAGLELTDPKAICSGGGSEEKEAGKTDPKPAEQTETPKGEMEAPKEVPETPAPSAEPAPSENSIPHTPPGAHPPMSTKVDEWDSDIMEFKHYRNLANAKDLESFELLLQARHRKNSSPSLEEYEALKKRKTDLPEASPEVLTFMKMVARQVVENINPIARAHAQATLPQNPLDKTPLGQDPTKSGPLANNPVVNSPVGKKAAEFANNYIEIAFKSIGAAIGAGLAGATLLWADGIAEKMTSPAGRIAIGMGLGGIAGVMAGYHGALFLEATNRAQLLRKLQRDFNAGIGAIGFCRSEDRNDPQKPNCYCFTPENQPNPARANSEICRSGQRHNYHNGVYTHGDNTNGFCIENSGRPDPKCACRQTQRSCLKATPPFMGGIDAGNFQMLATGFASVDQIGAGAFQAGSSTVGNLLNQAVNMKAAHQKIMKRPQYQKLSQKIEQDTKEFQKKLLAIGASHPSTLPTLRPLPATPAAAVAGLTKELERARNTMGRLSTPAASAGPSTGKSEQPQLELGVTKEEFKERQGQVAELMEQDMDIGVSDISNGEDLFKILSNRYQKSGMKRLFEENK